MNDFTREELGEIKSCVYFEGWKSPELENANQHLLDKIQAMIDNYCEHEFIATTASHMISTPRWHEAVIKCVRCGVPK